MHSRCAEPTPDPSQEGSGIQPRYVIETIGAFSVASYHSPPWEGLGVGLNVLQWRKMFP
jgi:hypothetical protein